MDKQFPIERPELNPWPAPLNFSKINANKILRSMAC